MKLFILMFSLFSIFHMSKESSLKGLKNPGPYLCEQEQLMDEIRFALIHKLAEKHRMCPIGISGGMPGGIIHEVGACFEIRRILTKEEIRTIIVDCIQEFANAININEKLKPYLKDYPFTEKNIDIMLVIYNRKRQEVYHPFISGAFTARGSIFYHTEIPENKYDYKEEWEEPFEEAIKLVQLEKEQQFPLAIFPL